MKCLLAALLAWLGIAAAGCEVQPQTPDRTAASSESATGRPKPSTPAKQATPPVAVGPAASAAAGQEIGHARRTPAKAPSRAPPTARLARILKLGKPKYDKNHQHVVELDLESQPTTDADLDLIARSFPHLSRLTVDGANITDAGVKHLAKLAGLVDLTLKNTDIHDETIQELQKLPKLKTLNLRRSSSLTNKALGYLKDYPSLQNLTLLYNNFDDDGMVYVQKIKNLRVLDIRCCQQIDDEGLAPSEGHAESPRAEDLQPPSPTPD